PDRGEGGAYCPWPPLYDLFCAAIARILGGKSAAEVLWRVVWVPPAVGAISALVSFIVLAKQFGSRAALAGGIALATSPFMVTEWLVGNIDHHYLVLALTFAIIGSSCIALIGS